MNLGEYFFKILFSSYKSLEEIKSNEIQEGEKKIEEKKKKVSSEEQQLLKEKIETEKLVMSELGNFPQDIEFALVETDFILYRCSLKFIPGHFKSIHEVLPQWVSECILEVKIQKHFFVSPFFLNEW